jgi:hypothetical protein
MLTRRSLIAAIPAGIAYAAVTPEAQAQDLSPGQATTIAKQAFIYGYPMVMNCDGPGGLDSFRGE